MNKSIELKPEITELYSLIEFIESIIQNNNMQIELILEEVFSNIVNYSSTEFIKVNAIFDNPTLTIEFIDNGIEFNPLSVKEHEIPDTIEEAEVGGLGIFLTKEISDEINYNYANGENHLIIIKRLEQ